MKLTHEEIEERLEKAFISKEMGYEAKAISEMNAMGVSFTFTAQGVRWSVDETHD